MTNVMNLLMLTFLVSCGNASLFDGKVNPNKAPLEQTDRNQEVFNDNDNAGNGPNECIDGFQYIDGEKVICNKQEYLKCHEGECIDGVSYINGEIVLCDAGENEFEVIGDIKCVGLECKRKFEKIDSQETTRRQREKSQRNSDWDFDVDAETREYENQDSRTHSEHSYEGKRVESPEVVDRRNTHSNHDYDGRRHESKYEQDSEVRNTRTEHDSKGRRAQAPKKVKKNTYTDSNHDSKGRRGQSPKEVEESKYTDSRHDSRGRKRKARKKHKNEKNHPRKTHTEHDYKGRKAKVEKKEVKKEKIILNVTMKKKDTPKEESRDSWQPCKSDEYRHHGKCLKKRTSVTDRPKSNTKIVDKVKTTPTTKPQTKKNHTSTWEPCKSDEYRHHGKCLKKRKSVAPTPKAKTKKVTKVKTTPTTKPQTKVKRDTWEPCKADEYRHHGKCLKKKTSTNTSTKVEKKKIDKVKTTTPTTKPQAKLPKTKKSTWEPCKADEYRHHGKCLKKESNTKTPPKVEKKKIGKVKTTTPSTKPQAQSPETKNSSWEPCKAVEYRHHGKCLKMQGSKNEKTPKVETSKTEEVESTKPSIVPEIKVADDKESSWEPCQSDEYRHHGKCLKMDKNSSIKVEEENKDLSTEQTPLEIEKCKKHEILKDGKCVKNKKFLAKEVVNVTKAENLIDMGELPNSLKDCISVNTLDTNIDFTNPIFKKQTLKLASGEVEIAPLSLENNNIHTLNLISEKNSTLNADRYHSEDFIMEADAVDYEFEGMGSLELKILKVSSLHNSVTKKSYLVISKNGLHAIVFSEDGKQDQCLTNSQK